MQKICANPWCKQQFEITDSDLKFYEKISPVFNGKRYQVPPPTRCPECRQQRRLAWRNERSLYCRPCNLTQNEVVSVYSQDKPMVIYNPDDWWSDKWDPCNYGQEFDFSKTFFEQLNHLMLPLHSKDCVDCCDVFHCQHCYECIDCWSCYNSYFCQMCKNITDSMFCYDCIGCVNCFGCIGLRNAKYHFFNNQCSKGEYEKLISEFCSGRSSAIFRGKEKLAENLISHPMRSVFHDNVENATGSYLSNSKDIRNCFDVEESETVSNSWGVEYAKERI